MKKKYVFLFALIIALLLLTFLLTFSVWNKMLTQEKILFNFLLNLPSWLIMGIIDFLIIKISMNKITWKSDTARIITDVFLCNLFLISLSLFINYLIKNTEILSYLTQFAIPLIIWNSIIIFMIELFLYNQRQVEVEKKLAITEKEKIQYQYETLKAQINPHFLFNSLNVLSSLAYQDAEKANLFTKKLSGVYRYILLTSDQPTVILKEELSFLESYLFLEKIRFENTFSVNIEKENEFLLNKNVIPISLQLLVENALKHNITTKNHPLNILIDIKENGILVSNNLQLRSSVDKGGVGLINLQKQYSLHNSAIIITQTEASFTVEIPFVK